MNTTNPPKINTVSDKDLYAFLKIAGQHTYAGGGAYSPKPQRPGFFELEYNEGNLFYIDSYTGYFRSRGMEVIRAGEIPLWCSLYGGGMLNEYQDKAAETFDFLKMAMRAPVTAMLSFRGPNTFSHDNWTYTYTQTGDISEFFGEETISLRGTNVFFHKIMGGRVMQKTDL